MSKRKKALGQRKTSNVSGKKAIDALLSQDWTIVKGEPPKTKPTTRKAIRETLKNFPGAAVTASGESIKMTDGVQTLTIKWRDMLSQSMVETIERTAGFSFNDPRADRAETKVSKGTGNKNRQPGRRKPKAERLEPRK